VSNNLSYGNNRKAHSEELAKILSFKIRYLNYRMWLISIKLENPNLYLSDREYYWQIHQVEYESPTIEIEHVTSNVSAVDGEKGYHRALAKECLIANKIEPTLVDLKELPDSK